MIKVAFVCLGNICRSPMAELIFSRLVKERGRTDISVASFGTSDEEEGNGIYPPAKRILAAHGITGEHTARRITRTDIDGCDYVLCMDSSNLNSLLRIAGRENAGKISRLCDHTDRPRDVLDPWYTRDFESAFADILDGCTAFLDTL